MNTSRHASSGSLNVERSILDVERSGRGPLRLLVISPEAGDPRESSVVAQLFAAGLTSYHLRKPTWTRDQLAAYLRALPPEILPRIVLHTHHNLATEFPVLGVHHREGDPKSNLIGYFRSRAVHDLATLRASLDDYDRLLLSPVFLSISKPGYGASSAFSVDALRAALALPRRAEVIALGGVDASRVPTCRDLGFDGVAVLGAVWNTPDPVAALRKLLSACSALSANSVVH